MRATECSTIPAKVIASCFGLMAFAAALVIGLAVDHPTQTILWRALWSMLLCWGIGYGVGLVAQQVVDRRIQAYKDAHPFSRATEKKSTGEEEVPGQENSGAAGGSPELAGRIPDDSAQPPRRQAS